MAYASNTNVSPERSQEEIRSTLRRYGASRFGFMEDDDQAAIMFEYGGKSVRMTVALPHWQDFRRTPSGKQSRTDKATREAWQKAVRQRWRALLLSIKAKLEAVETGISTMETEFMPFMVMPDGRTLGEHLLPKLDEAVQQGRMPQMLALPAPGSSDS